MLTAAAVAQLLGISRSTVYDLAKTGELASIRIRGAVRFDPADVQAYQQAQPGWKPTLTPRVLRTIERHRRRIPEQDRPPSLLTPEQLEIAEARVRNMRMPPWASGAAVRAIYAEARRITAETGIPHHVDHDIPLQGDFVSGLHVETNLQILPAVDNLQKKNRFEVDEC